MIKRTISLAAIRIIDTLKETKRDIFNCLVIVLLALSIFLWGEAGMITVYRDFPLNLTNESRIWNDIFLWNPNNNSGGLGVTPLFLIPNVYFSVTQLLGLSIGSSQQMMTYILTVIGGINMYFLTKKIFPKKNQIHSIAAFIYTLNILIPFRFLLISYQWAFAFLPLWMLCIHNLIIPLDDLDKNSKRAKVIILLTTPILSVLAINMTVFWSTMILLISWTIFFIMVNKTITKINIKKIPWVIAVYLLINLWWLYPQYKIFQQIIRNGLNNGSFNIQANLIRLYQIADQEISTYFELQPFELLSEYPVITFSLFITIVITLLPLLSVRDKDRKRYAVVLMWSLIAMIIATQLDKNINNFVLSLLKNPTIFSGEQIIIALSALPIISIAFSMSCQIILEKIQGLPGNRIKSVLTKIFIMIVAAVIISGIYPLFIVRETKEYSLQPYHAVVQIPTHWREIIHRIEKGASSAKILELTPNTSSTTHYSWKYQGFNLLSRIGHARMINKTSETDFNTLITDIPGKVSQTLTDNQKNEFSYLAKTLNIQYILLRWNKAETHEDTIKTAKKTLEETNYTQENDQEDVQMYKQKGEPRATVYATNKIQYAVLTNQKIYDLPDFPKYNTEATTLFLDKTSLQKLERPTIIGNIFTGLKKKTESQKTLDEKNRNPKNMSDELFQYEIEYPGDYQIIYKARELAYITKTNEEKKSLIFLDPYVIKLGDNTNETRKIIKEFILPENVEIDRSFFTINDDKKRYTLENNLYITSVPKQSNIIKIFNPRDKETISDDGTFEKSQWKNPLADCNNYDGREKEEVGIKAFKTTDAKQGNSALQLEAKDHVACVSTQTENIDSSSIYEISLWYKQLFGENKVKITVIERWDDGEIQHELELEKTEPGEWKYFSKSFDPNPRTKNFDVLLKTEGSQKEDPNINLFDDVSLKEIFSKDQEYEIDNIEKNDKLPFNKGEHAVKLTPEFLPTDIKSSDPSFETDSWNKTISDCNRFSPEILKKLNITSEKTEDATTGNFSLKLTADSHTACVSQTLDVMEKGTYQLSLDYKNILGQNSTRIKVVEYDSQATLVDKILPYTQVWKTNSTVFNKPNSRDRVGITLLMDGGDGKTNSVQYDNIQLWKNSSPSEESLLFYQEAFDVQKGDPLPDLKTERIHPGKYKVEVNGASTPFLIVLDELYDRDWIAYTPWKSAPDASMLKKYWRKIKKSSVKETRHYSADGYKNSWFVDKPGQYTLYLEYKPAKKMPYIYGLSALVMVVSVTALLVKTRH